MTATEPETETGLGEYWPVAADALNRYRLVYPDPTAPDGRVDFAFGDLASGFPMSEQVTVSRGDSRTQDTENTAADGRAFGQDFWGGDTYGFTLAVAPATMDTTDPATATWWQPGLDMHALFRRMWDAKHVRTRAGAVAQLFHDARGRFAFGRPRNIAPTYDRVRHGWSAIAADFETVDPYWYASAATELTLSVIPPTVGGLMSPLYSPLTSVRRDEDGRPGWVTNHGDVPAPTVVTFRGPATNPRLYLYDASGGVAWWLGLNRSLAESETAVIDTRPWRRSALINKTSPCTGAMRGAAMSEAVVPPGTYEVGYRATDGEGMSTATLMWRDTYTSL